MFSKRTTGVILVALLAVVAGCGGASPSDGDGGEPTATATDAGATTDSVETTTAAGETTTTAGDGDVDGTTTAGDGDDGGDETTTAGGDDTTTAADAGSPFADYAEKVRDAGGFAAEMTFETESESIPTAGEWTVRRNLEADSALYTWETTRGGRDVRVEQYHPADADRVHQCVIVGGSCSRSQTVPESEVSSPDVVTPFAGSIVDDRPDLTEAGTVDTEYGTLTRYRVDSADALDGASGAYGRYEEFAMEVLVEPDTGLVRRVTVDAVTDTGSGTAELTITIEYTEYGPVDVEPPDWYDG